MDFIYVFHPVNHARHCWFSKPTHHKAGFNIHILGYKGVSSFDNNQMSQI